MFWVPGDHFFGARNFSDFLGFSTSPNIASCCAPGTSGIRDFHFLLGVGIRAPHSVIRRLGAGIQSLESGIAAFGSPTRPSISTYSRSTAPAAVIQELKKHPNQTFLGNFVDRKVWGNFGQWGVKKKFGCSGFAVSFFHYGGGACPP